MVNGEFEGLETTITMDYRALADTAKVILFGAFYPDTVFDTVTFQIIDVTGTGSRRVIAVSGNGRQIL